VLTGVTNVFLSVPPVNVNPEGLERGLAMFTSEFELKGRRGGRRRRRSHRK
jgi:hypothetical protein